MNRRQLFTFLVMALGAGFVGGLMSRGVSEADSAMAQVKVETTTQPGGKLTVVEANEVRIKGFDGKTMLTMEPQVFRWDKPGNTLIAMPGGLNFIGFSSSINLGHEPGDYGIEIWSSAGGDNTITLRSPTSKARIDLELSQSGEPSIRLTDKKGTVRAVLGCVDLRTAKTGNVEKRSPSSLTLFDEEGKTIWAVP